MIEHNLLLEALLTAPHGHFLTFERDGQVAQFKADTQSPQAVETILAMQQGVEEYCRDLLRAYGSALVSLPVDLDAIQEPLRLMGAHDITIPREVQETFAIEDDFTGRKTRGLEISPADTPDRRTAHWQAEQTPQQAPQHSVKAREAEGPNDGETREGHAHMHIIDELQSAGWEPGVTLQRLATMDDFGRLAGSLGTRRVEVERHIGTAHQEQERWTMGGYCEVCQAASNFRMSWDYSDHVVPNYREHLQCPGCGLNNRQRFVASYLARLVGQERRDVYLYEQVTPIYQWATQHLTNGTVTGSEYLGPSIAPGSIINGIRHEDALNLTFPSESLDVIVSTDVYEHVPDIEKTITEARRVLRPGGKLLFSVPFFAGSQQTIQRAVLDASGEVQHLHPPQYHGNPVSPDEGSLVFYDYGWDMLDLYKRVGFSDAYALAYYSYFYGYLGEGLQLVFVAER